MLLLGFKYFCIPINVCQFSLKYFSYLRYFTSHDLLFILLGLGLNISRIEARPSEVFHTELHGFWHIQSSLWGHAIFPSFYDCWNCFISKLFPGLEFSSVSNRTDLSLPRSHSLSWGFCLCCTVFSLMPSPAFHFLIYFFAAENSELFRTIQNCTLSPYHCGLFLEIFRHYFLKSFFYRVSYLPFFPCGSKDIYYIDLRNFISSR